MIDLLKRFVAWVANEVIFPMATAIPGLPYLFRRQIINEYLTLAATVEMDKDEALVVTAMLDFTIKPWCTLAQLKEWLQPRLTSFDPPPA